MSKLTQVEAVTVTHGFVTIQTYINATIYQIQANLGQQNPNQNQEMFGGKALAIAQCLNSHAVVRVAQATACTFLTRPDETIGRIRTIT